MAELTLIQKFDAILDALYEISGKRPTYHRIKKVLRVKDLKIEDGEIWDILVKMETDKTVHLPVLNPNPKFPNEYLHLITFEGKLLKERGGLKGKIERDKAKWYQRNPLIYGSMVAIAGAILSVIVNVISDRVSKQSDSQEMQEIKQTIQDANHRLDSLTSILNKIPDSLKK